MAGSFVEVTEVGLRDGLQAEHRIVPTADKIAAFEALVEAGVRRFEVSSFVSPREDCQDFRVRAAIVDLEGSDGSTQSSAHS